MNSPVFAPSLNRWEVGQVVTVLLKSGRKERGIVYRNFLDQEGRRNAFIRVESNDLGNLILTRLVGGTFQQVNI